MLSLFFFSLFSCFQILLYFSEGTICESCFRDEKHCSLPSEGPQLHRQIAAVEVPMNELRSLRLEASLIGTSIIKELKSIGYSLQALVAQGEVRKAGKVRVNLPVAKGKE